MGLFTPGCTSGPNSPYIHADGKIYRRVADASDPKPETDKSTLDLLWQRSQKAHGKLAALLESKPILSAGEDNTTYINIFLLPDPLGSSNQRSILKFDKFVELMSDNSSLGYNFTCDNFYSIPDGFIGRQVGTNDPYNLTLTWKYYSNGFSIISLPLRAMTAGTIQKSGWPAKYRYQKEFLASVNMSALIHCWVIDLNQILTFMFAIIGRHRQLMESSGIKAPLYAKVALNNCWRRIPFLDTQSYIDFISKHGTPVIQFEDEFAPPDTSFESMMFVDVDSTKSPVDTQVEDAAALTLAVLNSFGLPTHLIVTQELWDASNRAQELR